MTAQHSARPPVIRITKLLPATPEDVFAAWTDPESLKAWMCPEATSVAAATLDLRVGGKFRIVMRGENSEIVHVGEYRDICPPERLVFTWQSAATLQQETLVTVELFPRGQQTELVLTHELFPDGHSAAQHQSGWQSLVEKLDRFLRIGQ
ncbi:MAG: SRPBCC domain-containing protein [Candidatus Binatia bacterium]